MSITECNKDVYNNGKVIAIISGMAKNELENMCQRISNESGHLTDWSFFAGRAIIKTLGCPTKMKEFLPRIEYCN